MKREKDEELRNQEKAKVAVIKGRIYSVTENKHKIKIYNCGECVAYDVNYKIPENYQIVCFKKVVPFEKLEPGQSFDEYVVLHSSSARKYKLILTWKDEEGKDCCNEILESW